MVSRHRAGAAPLPAESRQATLLVVRWGLAAVCLFLMTTGDGSPLSWASGTAIVAALIASNLALGRMQAETLGRVELSIGIAVLDALLVVAAWWVSGYDSFTWVILSLCMVNLALVGVSLGEIAAVAFASSVLYFVIG